MNGVTFLRSGYAFRWNQTGEPVAGTETVPFPVPYCLHIDANDTIYVCQHGVRSIEVWFKGATTGVKVTDANGFHANFAATDREDSLYFTEHIGQTAQRCSENSNLSVIITGGTSTPSAFNT